MNSKDTPTAYEEINSQLAVCGLSLFPGARIHNPFEPMTYNAPDSQPAIRDP